ncbi:hypothetical protein AB0I39_27315 [Kitasatospora purpeofusca]|uniref:hypothetical protein n=1 Tax=Kitasatospora purpeofusca TaxID=67352 RepID=UPI0033E7D3BA
MRFAVMGLRVPGGIDPEADDYIARTEPTADSGDRSSVPRQVTCPEEVFADSRDARLEERRE